VPLEFDATLMVCRNNVLSILLPDAEV